MGNKKKILVIDSDEVYAEKLQELLIKAGYDVEKAINCTEAMTKVEYGNPDMIVSDVILECHDSGFQFAEKLKRHPNFGKIPIVLLSSVMEKSGCKFSMEEDGHWIKADEYIEKPVSDEKLLSVIQDLINRKESNVRG